MSNIVSGSVHFGKIPDEHWYQPDRINETLAEEKRDKMVTDGTIYGSSVPYDLSSYPALYVIDSSDDIFVFQVSQYVPVQFWGQIYSPLDLPY